MELGKGQLQKLKETTGEIDRQEVAREGREFALSSPAEGHCLSFGLAAGFAMVPLHPPDSPDRLAAEMQSKSPASCVSVLVSPD